MQNSFTKHNMNLQRLGSETDGLKFEINRLKLKENITEGKVDKLKVNLYIQTASTYALEIHQELQTIISSLLFAK